MAGPDPSSEHHQQREAFFARVLHEHATLLYRVAFSVLRHPAEAEDAVADAMLKLVRTDAWKEVRHERAFLVRVVWRAAVDRSTARPPMTLDSDDLNLHDGRPSPELQSIATERLAVVNALIDALPLDLREPLLLSAVQDLNSREIGEAMHLPEGTVRTRLMRARGLLREQFEVHKRRDRDREVVARGSAG